jgi:hypothetical protein
MDSYSLLSSYKLKWCDVPYLRRRYCIHDSYGIEHYDLFGKTVYEYIKDNICDGDIAYMTCIELIYKIN